MKGISIFCLPSHLPQTPRFFDEIEGRPQNPTNCSLILSLRRLCERYVTGGNGVDGAASHLFEHCEKVWNLFVNNPVEAIQRHQDGSFFTHSPIDIWEALNQHLSRATSTSCDILHTMIADKISKALLELIKVITLFVQNLDTAVDNALQEVELELFCALANDMALHFEEIDKLIENFEKDDMKQIVDSLFDETTDNLVQCGQMCLRRLSALVISDIKGLLSEVAKT